MVLFLILINRVSKVLAVKMVFLYKIAALTTRAGLMLEKTFCRRYCGIAVVVILLLFIQPGFIFAKSSSTKAIELKHSRLKVKQLINSNDAVVVANPSGDLIFSQNADKLLIPASTLKIFTALIALHYLGKDYCFKTDFFQDVENNLVIKGYGDPLLTSEVICEIANKLASRLESYNDLILDDSYFSRHINIPGRSKSFQPFDAPNGALCVNFNTVFFKQIDGVYHSAEKQTPLLPVTQPKIRKTGLKTGRITLAGDSEEALQYAGQMFRFFFTRAGLESNGQIKKGRVQAQTDRLIYTHISKFSLSQVISRLLEFSNNFIANQLIITVGAFAGQAPGTLEKGLAAALTYGATFLPPGSFNMLEGSGISHQNKITARSQIKILIKFQPFHNLLRQNGQEYYKTGTLHNISTRAGYFKTNQGLLYPYVIMLNTPKASAAEIAKKILKFPVFQARQTDPCPQKP